MSASVAHAREGAELEAVALGIAAEATRHAVLEHCRACETCAAELWLLHENVSAMSASLPRSEMHRGHSAGIRSRLASRAAAEYDGKAPRAVVVKPVHAPEAARAEPRAPTPAAIAAYAEKPKRVLWPYVLAGIALVGAAVATMQALRIRDERDALATGAAVSDSGARRIAELEAAVREKDELIATVGSQTVRVINLVNWEARPRARMFWDRRTGRWTLFIDELRPAKAGMTFQVWMVTRAGEVAAGTFTPKPDGTAFVQGRQQLDGSDVRRIAISEEPIGGSPRPTGPVVLAGGGE